MGTDKATMMIEDRPLARRVADVLVASGLDPVVAVGGDAERLVGLGLEVVHEPSPGVGPLSGVAGALAAARGDAVVIAACDLPAITVEVVRRLVAARGDGDVAVPILGGVRQVQIACWGVRTRGTVERALGTGERSIQRVLDTLEVRTVEGIAADALADLDTPDDLDRYASGP